MPEFVQNYMRAKRSLFQSFNCPDDFYIKPMLEFNWNISEREGIIFLAYWKEGKSKTEAIVLKREYILKQRDFTMVVAIDCVKIAFIMNNSLEHR